MQTEENKVPQTEREVVEEELKHYVDAMTTDEIDDMTLDELREYAKGLSELNWKISAHYSNKKSLLEIEVKKSQELRVELAQWRYAARSLFFASVRVQTWIKAVRTNFDHVDGFTHHMKSVIQKMNGNILESAESELEHPVHKLRELAMKDNMFGDIPF